MDILFKAVLVLHIIGLAALIGGALPQLGRRAKEVTAAMVWGARAQIVTGLALVGLIYANDGEPDNAKIGVKLVVALAVAGAAESYHKRRGGPAAAWWAVLLLSLANVTIAVFWR